MFYKNRISITTKGSVSHICDMLFDTDGRLSFNIIAPSKQSRAFFGLLSSDNTQNWGTYKKPISVFRPRLRYNADGSTTLTVIFDTALQPPVRWYQRLVNHIEANHPFKATFDYTYYLFVLGLFKPDKSQITSVTSRQYLLEYTPRVYTMSDLFKTAGLFKGDIEQWNVN